MDPIPTIIMLPPNGSSEPERWVGAGRLAAASDLIERLKGAGGFEPILLAAAEPEQRETLSRLGVVNIESAADPFHFGQALTRIIRDRGLQQAAYFGGASAPLLTQDHLHRQLEILRIAIKPMAIVNNLYSSDWFMINNASLLLDIAERLPSDNPIGYVLSNDLGLEVAGMAPEAATRLDIDTPSDLALLAGHPALGPHLRGFLDSLEPTTLERIERIKRLLMTPASTLAIIGRCGSQVWQALERATQIWIRVFTEERGMVASRRLANGEVRSLIGEMVNQLGPRTFLERIGAMADGLLWDTRVWMGMGREWPSAADRFASDLGRADWITDKPLRDLTEASLEVDFPVLLGGYGVVAGGIYALLESIAADRSPTV
jgi:hypothetical protein